ncbi:MAG: efflux transporter periplasmic adaptor subunit [Gammaproteobacteria bacterium]|jgi:membrane fusion protein (multidrug efflux system)|nr:efflux transporter periplasmic adaptor subunit [Gammaproteobacteria bacterium]
MKKRLIIVLSVLFVLFGGIFGYHIFVNYEINKYLAHMQMPPAAVSVATAKTETWQPSISSVGTLAAVQGVNISPQVSGIVKEIDFTSGQMVKKGQVIIKLDTDVLKAQLQGDIAAQKLAQLNYNRDAQLLKVGAVARSQVDSDLSTLQQDKANTEQTQQELNQKIITAPFSGKLGIRQINLGQYLNPGDTITDLQTVDPIYVNYYVPQQNISQLTIGQDITVTVGTYPGVVFKGQINAIDAEVSNDNKSIAVQALIKNSDPKNMLYPGMFASVTTLLPQQESVITVPQIAISYTLYGNSVFVVTDQKDKDGKTTKTAKRVYVTTGDQRGDEVAITQGIKSGDVVVTDGQIKLQDVNPIIIVPSVSSS